MKNPSRYALDVEIVRETAKAVLVRQENGGLIGDDEEWLPKSQIETVDLGDVYGNESFRGREVLTVPGWLLRRLPSRMKNAAIPMAVAA